MKGARTFSVLTPAAAMASALATLSCCLPWGIGASFGALGLSVFFARFQVWFMLLSVVLLLFGFFQVLRSGANCRRRSRAEITLLTIATVVVATVLFFPQWVAGLFVGQFP